MMSHGIPTGNITHFLLYIHILISQEFIAISGFMPAGSVLFTHECVPKFEFGVHHRNTIRWSPFSRFVLLGGFGNLSGDMEIWETSSLTKVGTCKVRIL